MHDDDHRRAPETQNPVNPLPPVVVALFLMNMGQVTVDDLAPLG